MSERHPFLSPLALLLMKIMEPAVLKRALNRASPSLVKGVSSHWIMRWEGPSLRLPARARRTSLMAKRLICLPSTSSLIPPLLSHVLNEDTDRDHHASFGVLSLCSASFSDL
jgi:hypothetical protein